MLSLQQVTQFSQQGYLVLDSFVSRQQCEALHNRMQQLIDTHHDEIPGVVFSTKDNQHTLSDYFLDSADKIHFFLEQKALDENGRIKVPLSQAINKVGHGLHYQDDVFMNYAQDARFKTMCQQLGFERVGLLQSMYIFKQPAIGDEVQWHQDSTFLYSEGSDVIGFWLALEDATLENGCLHAIPSKLDTPLSKRMIVKNKEAIFIDEQPACWDEKDSIALEVKQGSLILLHGRLPHASGFNLSNKSRHAFALHAIDVAKPYPDNNWLQWPQAIPEL